MKGELSRPCQGALFLMRHGYELRDDGRDWWVGFYPRSIHPTTAATLIRRGLVVPAGAGTWRLP